MPNIESKPYFIVDLEKLKINYQNFVDVIQKYNRNDIIAYSIKANYDLHIIETLLSLGAYVEVSSDFEYGLVKKINVDSKRIVINGFHLNRMLTSEQIEDGAIVNIGTIDELKWLSSFSKPKRVGIRLNIDYIKQGGLYFSKQSRFGISPVDSCLGRLLSSENNIRINCLHCHFSGTTRDPSIYYAMAKEMCGIIDDLGLRDVEMLNLGGGYKIDQEFWKFEDYYAQIVRALKESHKDSLKLIFEPGNSLVRNTCTYCASVIGIHQFERYTDVIINGTKYHCGLGNRHLNDDTKIICKKPCDIIVETQRIVGCTCKESDVIGTLYNQPAISPGDQVTIENLGAYALNEIPEFLLAPPDIIYYYSTL